MWIKILLFAVLVSLVASQYGYEDDSEEFEGPFEPKPYSFGYATKDIHGEQHRHETRDTSGRVTGSYGFVDERGIRRTVYYVADHNGFRAKIVTNEPGTANMNPAAVLMDSTH